MDEKERLEKLEKFLAMKEMLKKIPGVIDVGVGFKETKGKSTEEIVYRVYVEEKKSINELPPEHVIPKEINGVKTDVVKIEVTENLVRPIRGGVKMDCESSSGFGTLGCMATHPVHGIVLLTNHHVLYDQHFDNSDGVNRGVEVGQPGISCSWCCKCNVIGHVKDSRRRNNGNVDCGIAKIIKPDIAHINEIDGGRPVRGVAPLRPDPVSGVMRPVLVDDRVKKTGAKTGFTEGKVKDVGVPVRVEEHDGTLIDFVDQIRIVHISGTDEKFADGGDSGSVLLNESNQVAGLIMSAKIDSPPYRTTANNIYNVISIMNITINVTEAAGGGASAASEFSARAITTAVNSEDEDTTYQEYLDKYKRILEQTPEGKYILDSIKNHAEEVRELVNHNRQVTVAWQRNQGPAFIAAFLKRLRNHDETIISEVNGVSIKTLMDKMTAALCDNGSEELRNDVLKYSKRVLSILDNCAVFEELISELTEIEEPVRVESN